ncbi:flavin-containing monooxygenase [Rubinisphaera sp. JC750]|uniref:flavin-containing monooxygenase n=1 Tax=Rubinisphaera sp. JC750 TaxID=2898658 RepID=UPI001F3325EB|nr:NAD(P)/FAD-dependent oxidoreductase [Rubinisphaera sp. JC750]
MDIVIIGAGLSGLCMGIQLKRAGINSFTILEKSQDVGGVWLDNTYPGCGCDVPAMLYSYSFALKPDWTYKYARQPELLEYFRSCADRFQIRPHIQFGVTVDTADFDEATGKWTITLANGETRQADVVISGVGQLSRPKMPNLPGLDSFQGESFHTARWSKDFDWKGKKIAIVGNGASAIQVVPAIAAETEHLYVLQRSSNYIAPRNDYLYSPWAKAAFRWIPGAAKKHREQLFQAQEDLFQYYERGSQKNWEFRTWLVMQMRERLDKKLWRKVVPKYPAGCKRVLLSDDYLQTLCRENVSVLTDGAEAITETGIVSGGKTYDVDAIVFATGFESTQFLTPMKIHGRDGQSLNERWKERSQAYLGLLVPQFPNFFLLYGPNTNLGHNSVIYMVECQTEWILKCLRAMRQREASTIEVSEQAASEFDEQLQANLDKLVWKEDCGNWYTNEAGHIVNNWSGRAAEYREATREFHPEHLEWNRSASTAAVSQ